jgi:RNA polymerase sigma-70 factor (ECF subfamily)
MVQVGRRGSADPMSDMNEAVRRPLLLPLLAADERAPAVARTPEPRSARAADARLTALFQEHFALVWRTVRRLGVPAAAIDDAVQEVFVVAQRRLASIEAGKERAFLYGTAVRVAATARRATSRRRDAAGAPREAGHAAVDGAADPGPAPDALVEQKRARELLDAIVARLPEDVRGVFVLYELEGLTMEEIAACLELPAGTVASRLRRARAELTAAVARIERAQASRREGLRRG